MRFLAAKLAHSYIPKQAIISDATLNVRVTDVPSIADIRLNWHYLAG